MYTHTHTHTHTHIIKKHHRNSQQDKIQDTGSSTVEKNKKLKLIKLKKNARAHAGSQHARTCV